MKPNIFILGSNSFSGSNYINLLLNKGYKVTGISRSKEINSVYLKYKTNKNLNLFEFYKLDLNKDLNKIVNLIQKKTECNSKFYCTRNDSRKLEKS